MKSSDLAKIALALALLGVAFFVGVKYFTRDTGATERVYYYDMSEGKLFAAPLESLPPIRGINDDQEDAVRAVVISTSANPSDKSSQKIAYLEKYAPQLLAHLAEVRAGKAEPMPSRVRDGYRFVKRPSDPEWHTVDSPEGQKILSEWNVPGPDGRMPGVCVP